MTRGTSGGPVAETSFESVWRVPDADVASGRIPGYVAAVRIGGQVEVHARGRTAATYPGIRPDATSASGTRHTLSKLVSATGPPPVPRVIAFSRRRGSQAQ